MHKTTRVFSMDLSLNHAGFAVVSVDEKGKLTLEHKAHVLNKTNKPHGWRLLNLYTEIHQYLSNYDITDFVREGGFNRFNNANKAIFKAEGVADLCVYTHEKYKGTVVTEIKPTQVKKLILGKGSASKEALKAGLYRYIGKVEFSPKDINNDESDAVAVALAYLIKEGKVKQKTTQKVG